MVEVESLRCVEALRDASTLGSPSEWRYTGIVQRDNPTGRKFGPAILTRLAIRDDLTRGAREFAGRRILEAHLEADGAPLVVLASHWTSRLRGDTIEKRAGYARRPLRSVPRAPPATIPSIDVILSGDFNDEPDDPSLRDDLHAVADPALVREDEPEPNLLDLAAHARSTAARGRITSTAAGKSSTTSSPPPACSTRGAGLSGPTPSRSAISPRSVAAARAIPGSSAARRVPVPGRLGPLRADRPPGRVQAPAPAGTAHRLRRTSGPGSISRAFG